MKLGSLGKAITVLLVLLLAVSSSMTVRAALISYSGISLSGTVVYEWNDNATTPDTGEYPSKTVMWGDGTTETVKVSDASEVFLNGRSVVAFGFHLKHGSENPSPELADQMLSRLQQDGVRFMAINFAYWENSGDWQKDVQFWFPKLYAHKMWVNVQVQFDGEEPPNLRNVNKHFGKHQQIINYICQDQNWAAIVFSWSDAWEIDYLSTVYESIPAGDVEYYCSQMAPKVRNALSTSHIGRVPVTGKAVGTYADPVVISVVKCYDIAGSDHYIRYGAGWDWWNRMVNQVLPNAGKRGHKIWCTEWGMFETSGSPGLANTLLQPSDLQQQLVYGNCGAIFIWTMYKGSSYNFAAFNTDGSAKNWYSQLASHFPKMVK